MKLQSMLKASVILGLGLGLAGCGTYYHGQHGHGPCASAGEKTQKARKVAQSKQQQVLAQAATKVVSTTTLFKFDNAELSEDGKAELDRYAEFLAQNPNTRVRVEGHTDEKGKPTYNLALGKRRADSVAKYLEGKGVPSSSIEVYSYGAENPVDYGNTDQAYAKNRRVEIFFEVNSDVA